MDIRGFEDIYDSQLDAPVNLLIDKNRCIIMYDENDVPRLGDVHEGYNGELFKNVTVQTGNF